MSAHHNGPGLCWVRELKSMSSWDKSALVLRLEEPRGPQREAEIEQVNCGEILRASLTLHREGTVRNVALSQLQGHNSAQAQLEGPRGLSEFRFHPKGGGKLRSFQL